MRDDLLNTAPRRLGGLSVPAAIAARDVQALNTALRQDFLHHAATVPDDLKAFKGWLVWRVTQINESTCKFDKLPFYPRTCTKREGVQGSPEDVASLGTWAEAITALQASRSFAGVGLAMLPEFGLTALDIDRCVEAGEIRGDAAEITDGTYCEISPSGTGIRAFWIGLARNGKDITSGVELYSEKQFVTVTGKQVGNGFSLFGETRLPVMCDDMRQRLESMAASKSRGKLTKSGRLQEGAKKDRRLQAIIAAGLYERELGDGKHSIRCPFEESHSDFGRRGGDGDTVYMQARPGTHEHGYIYCSHTHGNDQDAYWAAIGYSEYGEGSLPDAWPVAQMAKSDARDGTNDSRPLTEYGNAMRLFDANETRLRWVHDARAWIAWTAGSWQWDSGAGVRALAARLPHDIYADGARHIGEAEYFTKWARKSQEQRTINAAVALLSDFGPIRLPVSCIDSDPYLVGFNRARQVVDLKTGRARDANPGDYVTKSLKADAIGEASSASRWAQFLDQVFCGDRELIGWLQRFCGYLLTGSTQEQFFLFCFGYGANGKSVFIEMLKHIMGEYSRAIASETLSESKRTAGAATPDLAALIGARLAICGETEDNTALAESLVKSLVAGDSMEVRQLYAAPVQFTPCFKLVMAGNHKPMVRGNDNGIWRRVRLVPFNRTFAPGERDPYLLDKLKAETPHILAWMVEGCIRWQQRRLTDTPQVIRQATDAYRADQDIIGDWLAECAENAPGGEVLSNDLYANYKSWCMDNGNRPASNRVLSRRLSERGFNSRPSNGKRYWGGLRLVQSMWSVP